MELTILVLRLLITSAMALDAFRWSLVGLLDELLELSRIGRIWVESEGRSSGSICCFTLPVKE